MGRDFKTHPTVNGAPVILTINHGDDATVPRPDAPMVIWRGTVEPLNWTDDDIWHDKS